MNQTKIKKPNFLYHPIIFFFSYSALSNLISKSIITLLDGSSTIRSIQCNYLQYLINIKNVKFIRLYFKSCLLHSKDAKEIFALNFFPSKKFSSQPPPHTCTSSTMSDLSNHFCLRLETFEKEEEKQMEI